MIVTRLIGGLGNQMFQYAVGRAISYRYGDKFKIDISGFNYYKLRDFRLDVFNIKGNFATQKDIEMLIPRKTQLSEWMLYRAKLMMLPDYKKPYVSQKVHSFDPDIVKIKKNAYLNGYWQSELYFVDVADIIRNDFTLKEDLDEQNINIQEEIINSNSVSMHIRRGDYVSNPKTRKTHGALSLDYYNSALEMMTQKANNPVIYVFSDDIPWVQDNLKTELPLRFMNHNDSDHDYKDLLLMRACKHHIIANSSFSWWGAWLSEYAGKIVIAPRQWFSPAVMKRRGRIDIIPQDWIVL